MLLFVLVFWRTVVALGHEPVLAGPSRWCWTFGSTSKRSSSSSTQLLSITFRRDPTNYRPRINKLNSQMDAEQKSAGNYFFLDTDDEEPTSKSARKAEKAKQLAAEAASSAKD